MHWNRNHFLILIPKSFNWSWKTELGAPSINDIAEVVLGNAITSLILLVPASNITNRSNPNAIPPWGGVPYLSASIKNPNLSSASFLSIPNISKITFCCSESWILTEPPATSYPLIIKSYCLEGISSGDSFNFFKSLDFGCVKGCWREW